MSIRIPPLPLSRSLVQFGAPRLAEAETNSETAASDSNAPKVPPRSQEGDRRDESAGKPSAAFLTHLIAIRMNAEQFRAKRRISPDLAVAAYGAPVFQAFSGQISTHA
jgi:hypothetical protein